MITIIDYGMGNLGSILNLFKRIGVEAQITADLDEISNAEKILLPGVGAFDNAMKRINESGLRELLDKKALDEKIPILGICLGMQLLTNRSDEGEFKGLGWIDADTTRIPAAEGLKVPHMGWNIVEPANDTPLNTNLPEESRFYFVHSYAVHVKNEANSLFKSRHGIDFDAGIYKDNIFGTQFHPEKSHKFGMQLLKNFSSFTC